MGLAVVFWVHDVGLKGGWCMVDGGWSVVAWISGGGGGGYSFAVGFDFGGISFAMGWVSVVTDLLWVSMSVVWVFQWVGVRWLRFCCGF